MNIGDFEKKYASVQERLAGVARAFPWEDQACYVSWLAQTHEYARFSTRILALTAGHLPLDQTKQATRFIQHAAEEKGHDRLLVNDAKALGYDLNQVPVLPAAEAFHKSLYFWIYQGYPSVILGWVFCLEGFAVLNGPTVAKRALGAHGRAASTFMGVHANEDPDHLTKAFRTLGELGPDCLVEICRGLELYANLYENVYRSIEASVRDQRSEARAA